MPHGSNDSSVPDDVRSRIRRLRSRGSGHLHSRGSGAPSRTFTSSGPASPSRAVVPAAQSSIGSWPPDDRPGSRPGERGGSGHPDIGDQCESDHADQAGQSPLIPQYHWHQDTHHHYYAQLASPQPQPPRQTAFALPSIPQAVAQPRLAHTGGCLVVFLVLLGAFLTFLVMLMGLALAGQILMLR